MQILAALRNSRALLTLLVPLLVSAVVQAKEPAGRDIIADLDRIVTPNGVQENYTAEIGGIRQWIYVRGQDRNNPILLFVHGGPASPNAPVMWAWQKPLEEYFTVVNYDQRGAGKTYLENDPALVEKTLRIDRFVQDAVDIASHVARRYNKKKVIIAGHSWGTIVGMKAALARPDLFYAYVGIGQAINVRDNERVSFDYALATAEKMHNDKAVAELKSIAPYPGDKPLTRERIIIARNWAQYYGGLSAYRHESAYYFDAPLLSPDYDAKAVAAIDQGNMFTLSRVLDEFLNVDLKPVKRFPIPVIMFMGRHDYTTPSEPTQAWLDKVEAPYKKGVWFENSSHLLHFEEPGKLLVSFLQYVRPFAVEGAPTSAPLQETRPKS